MSGNRTRVQILSDIEAEYGQAAREVVAGYYCDDRLPLRDIAAILALNEKTLRKLLAEWQLPRRPHKAGYTRGEVIGKVTARAHALGYASLGDAILSLRRTGHTYNDICLALACSKTTVVRACPPAAHGIVVLTEARRAQLCADGVRWGRRMQARRRARLAQMPEARP